MYTLSTLEHLRRRLGLSAADTGEDARLLAALQAASAQIERAAGRRFMPYHAAIRHDIHPRYRDELLLSADLLQLDSLTNGDGSTIDPLDVILLPDWTADGPACLLRLTGGQRFTWLDSPRQAVTVTGVWGWHDRWLRAWRDSADTVQDDPLNSSAVTLHVSSISGTDSHAAAPRFQTGHLLRIDDEYLRVLAVNPATQTLTVLRGVQGTTAAGHTAGTRIDVFQPAQEVDMLCLRWALWLYKEPDSRAFAAPPAALAAALDGLRRAG
jgi:hypothetical protein